MVSSIERLLHHPRNRHIRAVWVKPKHKKRAKPYLKFELDPGNGAKKTLSGMLGVLEGCFYPHYEYKMASGGRSEMMTVPVVRVHAATKVKKRLQWTAARPGAHAKKTGTLMDGAMTRQINGRNKLFLQLVKDVNRQASPVVPPEAMAVLDKYAPLVQKPKKTTTRMGARATALLDAHASLGILPLACQFMVYSTKLRMATAMDGIGIKRYEGRWRLIALEYKSGYDEIALNAFCGFMKPPLEDITDCPKHQFILQILVPILTLEKEYDIEVKYGVILRAPSSTGAIHKISLPDWAWERREAIWEALIRYRQTSV